MPRKTTARSSRSRPSTRKVFNKALLARFRGRLFTRTSLAIFLGLFVVIGAYLVYSVSRASSEQLESGVNGNQSPSYCLDDTGGGTVRTAACNGMYGQQYSLVGDVIHLGGYCLGVSGANSTSIGRFLVADGCSPTPWGAVWTPSGNRLLDNHADALGHGTQYCLDVSGNVAGHNVDIWPCNGGSNQNWYEQAVGGGSGGNTPPVTPKPTTPGPCTIDWYGVQLPCQSSFNLSSYSSSTSYNSTLCVDLRAYEFASNNAITLLGLTYDSAISRYPNCFNANSFR